MNSARRMKLRRTALKPRNPLVLPAAQRKAGEHRKSRSAERQQQKAAVRKSLRED